MVCSSNSLKVYLRNKSVCPVGRSTSECASQHAPYVSGCAVVLYMHSCVSTHINLHNHASCVSLCIYSACREYAQV